MRDDNLNTIVATGSSAATETYLVIGAEKDISTVEANNICKYLKTKFVRFLISLAKANQNGTRQTYRFVPNQIFDTSSDINWSKSISKIDFQLFKKYNFTEEEVKFINDKIQRMDGTD